MSERRSDLWILLLQFVHNHELIVGVTPLAVSGFTNGFDTSFDITWNSGFQDVCGIIVDDRNLFLIILAINTDGMSRQRNNLTRSSLDFMMVTISVVT